jgi:IclR helix-turn-helix domain
MTTQPDDGLEPPSDLVRSVSRALAVLEVVGSFGGPMSAKAVARRTGLNLSTAYHLLRTLTWEGYLVRLPSGDYRLGGGVTQRYRELVGALSAPVAVREVLEELASRTRLTAYLGRAVDGRAALTDVLDGSASPPVPQLVPGFDDVVLATPLGQLLGNGGVPSSDSTAGQRLLVEDGRLQPDVSCAALVVRRCAPAEGTPVQWGIGLIGPLGCFAGGSGTLRALVQAGDRLVGMRSVRSD